MYSYSVLFQDEAHITWKLLLFSTCKEILLWGIKKSLDLLLYLVSWEASLRRSHVELFSVCLTQMWKDVSQQFPFFPTYSQSYFHFYFLYSYCFKQVNAAHESCNDHSPKLELVKLKLFKHTWMVLCVQLEIRNI